MVVLQTNLSPARYRSILVDIFSFPSYNAIMRRFGKLLSDKFQEWAVNRLLGIIEQWIAVTVVIIFDHTILEWIFIANETQIVSQVADYLWIIDTIYVVASVFRNLFRGYFKNTWH